MSYEENLKEKAFPFATLNIAREIINLLSGKTYGQTLKRKMSMDKEKFQLKVA